MRPRHLPVRCLLWVINGISRVDQGCPLNAQKRTSSAPASMSAKCQKQTSTSARPCSRDLPRRGANGRVPSSAFLHTCHQLFLRSAARTLDLIDDLHIDARDARSEGGKGGTDRLFNGGADLG